MNYVLSIAPTQARVGSEKQAGRWLQLEPSGRVDPVGPVQSPDLGPPRVRDGLVACSTAKEKV